MSYKDFLKKIDILYEQKAELYNQISENKYIAKCDNKVNSTCKFSEDEFKAWNGKCCYRKDGGIYCTSNFELIRATVEELIVYLKKIFPKGNTDV